MGRGRQRAKQTKLARNMKYHTADMDVEALQRELAGLPPVEIASPDADDDADDPYAAYYDGEFEGENADDSADSDEDDGPRLSAAL